MPRSDTFQRGADAIQEQARLLALVDELTFQPRPTTARAPAAGEVPLLGRVVVGVGTDPASRGAEEWAEAMSSLFHPRVTLVHVETPLLATYPGAWGTPIPLNQTQAMVDQEEIGRRLLDDSARRFREMGLDVSVHQPSGSPVREITKAARDEDADLIIVGAPTRSALDRFLIGNVADGVKNHAGTNVLLAKAAPTPGDVLCPVDGSPMSKRAAALALRIARAWGSTLHVLHVLQPAPDASPGTDAQTLRALQTELDLPWGDLPRVDFRLLMGDPADEIEQDADRTGARLIVMGNRGLGGLRSLVTGSVTNHVAHHVAQSLLLVKGPKFEMADAGFVI